MTVPLLYLAGVLLVFLTLHYARGSRSPMWRPSVTRPQEDRLRASEADAKRKSREGLVIPFSTRGGETARGPHPW